MLFAFFVCGHNFCEWHKSAGLAYHPGNCIRLRKLCLQVVDAAMLRSNPVRAEIVLLGVALRSYDQIRIDVQGGIGKPQHRMLHACVKLFDRHITS